MTLKRKRSDSHFSPSSTSSYSARDTSSPTPFQIEWPSTIDTPMGDGCEVSEHIQNWAMAIDQAAHMNPSHLHSRTRKRLRDNRPSEGIIHENTYQRLFQAQRQGPVEPVPSIPRPALMSSVSSQKQAQTSLHSFWAIPHRPSAPSHIRFDSLQHKHKCEDCDSWVTEGDDAAMDLNSNATEYGCRQCSRIVCHMCAVVNVGLGRECLQCSTSRKRWVGGIGWI